LPNFAWESVSTRIAHRVPVALVDGEINTQESTQAHKDGEKKHDEYTESSPADIEGQGVD
jgi:hypothetical protein